MYIVLFAPSKKDIEFCARKKTLASALRYIDGDIKALKEEYSGINWNRKMYMIAKTEELK